MGNVAYAITHMACPASGRLGLPWHYVPRLRQSQSLGINEDMQDDCASTQTRWILYAFESTRGWLVPDLGDMVLA
jgi:hypothetical protein